MRYSLNVLKAEILKQHRQSYNSYFVYFSLLVWPILGFFTVYFTYKPFSLGEGGLPGIKDSRDLIVFLSTGYMAYTCFWSMVQSAWSQSNRERQGGTLELAFLSPANRLALMYGKALGALLEETWMFISFCTLIIFWSKGIDLVVLALLPLVYLILLISATIWGGMLNTIFMFSRDASILMNLFDDPMVLFAGVRVPTNNFPYWAQSIALVFPLTYCLNIIRSLFMTEGKSILWNLVQLALCLAVMVGITIFLVRKAEKKHRRTGELTVF